ncbi:MAG: polysaccharide deacetylase family protein [Candidatus Parcubacteria bacterium]|nr:polysaccharide deacetylase family protein [Candidatus Parcubacteria bacterium]
MLPSPHRKTVLTGCGVILSLISIVCLFSLLGHTVTVRESFLNNQALYAEVPSSKTPLTLSTISTEAVQVPILVYHIIRPSYASDSAQVRALAQTPEIFDAQMQYLRDNNYHVISFTQLENYFNRGTPLPPHSVIISFDDGWGDQFKYAFPILQTYNYTATFFVFTNPINTRGFMTWDNLRALKDAGMTIGAHSRSHPFLNKITNPDILTNEINGSKKSIEEHLGITVRQFAYPFGQYNASTTAEVRKAGFSSARGDYVLKTGLQSAELLYELNAFNVPTTTALFIKKMSAF